MNNGTITVFRKQGFNLQRGVLNSLNFFRNKNLINSWTYYTTWKPDGRIPQLGSIVLQQPIPFLQFLIPTRVYLAGWYLDSKNVET